MVLIISGKGDPKLLNEYQEGDFSAYELHTGLYTESFFQELFSLPKYITFIAVHNPSKIKVQESIYPFDLSAPTPIGEESFRVFKKTIKLAKRVNAKIVVVHGAKYDLNQPKEEAFSLLACRIKSLDLKDIILCFETDALWHNTFYPQKSLLITEDDFIRLDQLLEGNLKITADIEHLQISFYFSRFIECIGGEKKFTEIYPPNNQIAFEIDIQRFIKQNNLTLPDQFKKKLASFFIKFKDKIEHIHLNGSDPFNFTFDPETFLPLIGEHLPLGFEDETTKDRFDYNYLTQLFYILPEKKRIHIVIEAWRKNSFEFIFQMLKSKQFLTKHLEYYGPEPCFAN